MIASSCNKRHFFQACPELHPPRPSVPLLPYFPIILLNFILYLPLYTSVYILQLDFIIINMEPMASQGGITIHRRIKKPTLKEHLHVHWRRQPIFIADQMFALPTQRSSIVLEIANVCAIILTKEDDDDTDWAISENEREVPGESTLSSDIEEDHLGNQQEVLHLDQPCRDKSIRATRVPLPKKRSCADTDISYTSLRTLRHPAGALAPPMLKCQKSTINILHESDVVPPPRRPHFPRLVESRIFLNQRLAEIPMFLNTKRLLVR